MYSIRHVFPSMEQFSNPIKRVCGYSHSIHAAVVMDILVSLIIIVSHRIHSEVRLLTVDDSPPRPPPKPTQHLWYYTKLVKKGSFLFSTNLISPQSVTKMCIIFSNRFLLCNILYYFWYLQDATSDQQLERTYATPSTRLSPDCRVAPIKCFSMNVCLCEAYVIVSFCFFQTTLGVVIYLLPPTLFYSPIPLFKPPSSVFPFYSSCHLCCTISYP